MYKRISSILLLLIIFALPLTFLDNILTSPHINSQNILDGNYVLEIDERVRNNFPYAEKLQEIADEIRFYAGQKEIDGIFLSKDGAGSVIENIDPPIDKYVSRNVQAIIDFSHRNKIPTYAMIIPSASAIKQQLIPDFAPLFNQKNFIDTVYARLAGNASTVDVYPTLFANRDEYIYYRTENNLSGLGGYYVYTILGKRLGFTVNSLSSFNIENSPTSFYGTLMNKSHYKKIQPDIISMYHLIDSREYILTHTNSDSSKMYNTLYPTHLLNSSEPLDTIIGGFSPVIKIESNALNEERLLILGDKTALAYVPLLAPDYKTITIVDLFSANKDQLNFEHNSFNQALFAYDIQTFIHSDIPSRASTIILSN